MQPSLTVVEVLAVDPNSVLNVPDGAAGSAPDPCQWAVIVACTGSARKGFVPSTVRRTATSPANCWTAPAWAGAISVVWITGWAPFILGQVTTAVTTQICRATSAFVAQMDWLVPWVTTLQLVSTLNLVTREPASATG